MKKDIIGTTFTRADGTDCHSGKIYFQVGKTAKDLGWRKRPNRFSGAIHFGEPRAVIEYAVSGTLEIPKRAFEVKSNGELFETRKSGAFIAQSVKVIKELSLCDILAEFAKDADLLVRAQAAQNPYTPPEFLVELVNDKNAGIRSSLAKNPHTPVATLVMMVKDASFGVRNNIASNPNTSCDTLMILAEDQHSYVRMTVAKNPHTPPETLSALSDDGDRDVRAAVARNRNLPQESRVGLANDMDSYV